MKKIQIIVALALAIFSTSCVDYSFEEPQAQVVNPQSNDSVYVLKVASAFIANDTIYGSVGNEILFFVTNKTTDALVAIQCDFGDGVMDGGDQVLHQYKADGIYKLKITIVGTGIVMNRIVKIGAPVVVISGETIIQLSGSIVGDSANISLLCRKDKINSYKQSGNYFLKGDMTNWKKAISAVDTNFVSGGVTYLKFNFKVKNSTWCSFGYYKVTSNTDEHWGYDPSCKFWDLSKGLYKFYVLNGQIYQTQLSSDTPGSFGDPSSQKFGPTIRGSYETNGTGTDSLVIFANKNYLNGADTLKMGIGYSVDGQPTTIKKARFLKNSAYFYIKVPVTKSSSVRFKTYKDTYSLIPGDMTSSIFYDSNTQDCYLIISGAMQGVRGITSSKTSSLSVIAANGEKFSIN